MKQVATDAREMDKQGTAIEAIGIAALHLLSKHRRLNPSNDAEFSVCHLPTLLGVSKDIIAVRTVVTRKPKLDITNRVIVAYDKK